MDVQFAAILLLSLGLHVHAETYMVVFPRWVRPGTDLVISTKYLQPITAETVTAELVDRYNGKLILSTVSGQATADKPEVILNLEIPAGLKSSNIVRVTGSGDFPFHNETYVNVRRKAVSILVQSDKSIYKAGDTVKYRIFGFSDALDQADITMDIAIYDSQGNKLDERNGVSTDPDVSGEFPLSEMPNLGRWRIEVKPTAITIRKSEKTEMVMNKQDLIDRKQSRCDKTSKLKRAEKCYRKLLDLIGANTNVETVEDPDVISDKNILEWSAETYYFDVQEYVLPKFEVTVHLPGFGLIRDEYLYGSVKAKYTFGQPVQGHAVVTVSREYMYYYYYGFYDPISIQKKFTIDGEANFEFPKKLLDALTRSFQYTALKVHASVTETISGVTLSGEYSIRYYKEPYTISFNPSQPEVFKPNFPYPLMVKVTYQDGRPADISGRVKVTATYFTEHPTNETLNNELQVGDYDVIAPYEDGRTIIMKTRKLRIGADGIAFLKDMEIPDIVATGNIMVQFKGQQLVKNINRFRSRRNYFLKIEQMKTGPLEIGERAVFRLKSNVEPVQGCYQIISKDDVAAYGTFEISGRLTTSIVVMLTRDMSPSARLVAYYIRDTEIVADALNIRVEEIYENKVSVEFDQMDNVAPKTDVKLKVSADKDSVVNVLVVDRSVKLLKEGNDVTPERIQNELGRYGDFPIFYSGWRHIPWSYPADDSAAIFSLAKLVVFTDADLYSYVPTHVKQQPPIVALPDEDFIMRQEDQVVAAPCEGPGCSQGAEAQLTGQIRTEFPETWVWKSAKVGADGVAEFPEKVPDTITTWVASAFALNSKTGLGVAPVVANLTAFLPFFVTTHLAYSVVRGEILIVQANVFSYYPEDLEVLVIFRNHGDFIGIDFDSEGGETEVPGDLMRCVFVESGKPTPVFFQIRTLNIGTMSVNIRILETRQRYVSDEIFKPLLVKGEGEEITENFPFLISYKFASNVTSKSADVTYPPGTVPNSQKIRVVAAGDIFGSSFANLDRLIRLPWGCGEQNIITFAPTIFAVEYMLNTNRPMDLDEVRDIFIKGYQRQILYKRHDGSFSAWGNADPSGSLWLTAFVAKSFAMAFHTGLVYIDPDVMDGAVQYIMNNQNPSGAFIERGRVIHRAMQGGTTGSKGSLVAYVLISLKEVKNTGVLTNQNTIDRLDLAIAAAENFLNTNIEPPIPDFEAAIAAYANPANGMFLQALEASENISYTGGKHWTHPSYSRQIEMAAYALLAYTDKKDTLNGNAVLEWLVERRNIYGGYSSSQETVVALQALSGFAKLIYTKSVDMVVDVFTTTGGVQVHKATFAVTEDNHDVLQFVDFDGEVDSVDIAVSGEGLAVVEVNKIFNVEEEFQPPSYSLTLLTYDDESPQEFMLQACTRYLIADADSGMAVMSVGVPSGYEASKEGISAVVEGKQYVRKVERSGDRLIIYFDQILSEQELCVDIKVTREIVIEGIKRANVVVYSYYEPDERVMKTYMPKSLENVSICNECGAECGCGANALVLPLDQCEVPVPQPEPPLPPQPVPPMSAEPVG